VRPILGTRGVEDVRRDVDTLVLNAVNTCWKTPITLPVLLHLLRQTEAPGEWGGHIRQFFQDVPVEAIRRFCTAHDISPEAVRRYYERHILPLGFRNLELEQWVGTRPWCSEAHVPGLRGGDAGE
jgi:hypothetical protein